MGDRLETAEGKEREREVAELAESYRRAPVARLRQIAAAAQGERAGKKPPKAYRELFRLLKAPLAEEGDGVSG